MATNVEELLISFDIDTSKFDSSLKGMMNEIKALNKLPIMSLSDAEKNKVNARIGELRKGIKDLKDEQAAMAAENPFQTMTAAITPLIGGMAAAAGAMRLFGVENETLNRIIEGTQSLTIGLMAINNIAQLDEQKAAIAKLANNVKEFISNKLLIQQYRQKAAAIAVANNATKAQGIWTAIATKAQWLWNAAMAASPIGAIIAAIAALVAGIILLVKWLDRDTDSQEKNIVAMDGAKFSSKELADAHNENVAALQELDTEYRNAIGAIDDYTASVENLNTAYSKQLNFLENEYLGKVKEIAEKQFNFWRSSWAKIVDIFTFSNKGTLAQAERYAEKTKVVNEEYYGPDGKITQIRVQHEEKLKIMAAKNEIEIAENKKKKYLENYKNFKDAIQKDLDALKQNLEKQKELLKQRDSAWINIQTYISESTKTLSEMQAEEEAAATEAKNLEEAYIGINKQLMDINANNQILLNNIKIQEIGAKAQLDALNALKNPYQDLTNIEKERGKTIENNIATLQANKKAIEDELTSLNEAMVKAIAYRESVKKGSDEWIEANNAISNGLDAINTNELKLVETNTQIVTLTDQLYDSQSNIANLQGKQIEFDADKVKTQAEYNGLLAQESALVGEIAKIRTEEGPPTLDEWEQQNNEKVALEEALQKRLQAIRWKYMQEDRKREREHAIDVMDYRLAVIQMRSQEIIKENDKIRKTLTKNELDAIKKQEQEKLDIEKDALKKYYDARIAAAAAVGDNEGMAVLIEQQKAGLQELEDAYKERWDSIAKNVRDTITDLSGAVANAVMEIFQRDVAAQFDMLNERLSQQTEAANNSLNVLRDKNLISEDEYTRRQQLLQENADKKANELRVKQAKAEKRMAIFQILIDTAMAVAKSWGQGGGLLGLPLAAIAAAMGAIQLGIVASQPIPEFAKGGKVRGRRHAFGGTVGELETGEFIVNRNSASQPGVEGLLNMINGSANRNAAVPTTNTANMADDNIIGKIVQQTINGISQIPVTNLESEYSGVQRKVKSIETRAKF